MESKSHAKQNQGVWEECHFLCTSVAEPAVASLHPSAIGDESAGFYLNIHSLAKCPSAVENANTCLPLAGDGRLGSKLILPSKDGYWVPNCTLSLPTTQ